MYSTYNEGKSVVTERSIMTLKNKVFKQITAVSKNAYFDVLDNTIKMKPIDITSDSFVEYNKDSNKNDAKYKVGNRDRISKYKNIFDKGYTPNWSKEVSIIRKIKNTAPQTSVISDLNGEKIGGSFYEKKLQNTSQEKFTIEKLIKRKGDKLYIKWKGYDNSFNSWIN